MEFFMNGKIKSVDQFFEEMQAKYAGQHPELHQKVMKEMRPSLEVVFNLPSEQSREKLLEEAEFTYRGCLNILLNNEKAQGHLRDLSQATQDLAKSTKKLIGNLKKLEQTLTETERKVKTSERQREILINFDTDKVLVS